jgi:hypothetical protein
MLPSREWAPGLDEEVLEAAPVVAVLELAALSYTSISRRSAGLNASGIESQAGTSLGRAVSWQSAGMTPSFF